MVSCLRAAPSNHAIEVQRGLFSQLVPAAAEHALDPGEGAHQVSDRPQEHLRSRPVEQCWDAVLYSNSLELDADSYCKNMA